MADTSIFQATKLAVMAMAGLSRDALHVYAGLAVFLAVAIAARRPLSSAAPLLAVIAVAVGGELLDMRDDVSVLGHWRWGASVHDIVNTAFWPLVVFVLARYTGSLSVRGR